MKEDRRSFLKLIGLGLSTPVFAQDEADELFKGEGDNIIMPRPEELEIYSKQVKIHGIACSGVMCSG